MYLFSVSRWVEQFRPAMRHGSASVGRPFLRRAVRGVLAVPLPRRCSARGQRSCRSATSAADLPEPSPHLHPETTPTTHSLMIIYMSYSNLEFYDLQNMKIRR